MSFEDKYFLACLLVFGYIFAKSARRPNVRRGNDGRTIVSISSKGFQPVLTQDCKVVWYGKLKVDSKATPVIFDPQLSPSIKGCIYLYNSERDEIVQYTWNIVQGLLIDVDKTEKNTIKKTCDAKWKAARKKFTKGKMYAFTSQHEESVAVPAPAPENSERRWDSTDDGSFELEDLS
ncbi:MAG TPA: hypothetical protein VIV27_03110 [Halioglobus sp.]